ncbi:hypothetical protein GCM10020331_057570 [Ectobacillus funiculus]
MEPNQPGNKEMPDFKELEDRVIAEPAHSPSLVIQTKLDPKKNVKEDNPYYRNEEKTDDRKFQEYF